MTVNTLGSDSRIGGDSVATQKSQDSRTVAEWLWPLLSGGVALFAISALFYYHFYLQPDQIAPASFLQHTIVGIYNVFGLAPSVVFFLMVFAWSSIWAVTGILERPLARLGRLLVMALMVGVFLNLGSGGVASDVHTGSLGAWVANRLVVGIGYVFSIILVGPTMFASLMLATDWFFSEWFERDRKTSNFETGVEPGVTDHLRGLSEVANRPQPESPPQSDAAAEGVDQQAIAEQLQRVAAAAVAEPTVVIEAAPVAAPEPVVADAGANPAVDVDGSDADGSDGDAADGDAADAAVLVPPRPFSYSERRRQRAERRLAEEAAVEVEVAADLSLEAPEDVSEPQQAAGAVMVTEAELESLFGEDTAAVATPEQAAETLEDDLADEVEDSVDAEDEVEDAESEDADEEFEDEEFEESDEQADEEEVLEDEEDLEEHEELEEHEDGEEEELEDDEEIDEDEDEDADEDEEFEDEELEEEDEEDEESVAEVDAEFAELEDEELEDDELEEDEDDDELEDEELEDGELEEDEEDGDEEEEGEDEELDVSSAVADEPVDAEVLVSEPSASVAELASDDLADDLADEDTPVVANADEPAEYAEEEIVSIPRPDEAPAVALPTPPKVRDPEEAPSSRQQKLFGSQVDEDLMAEAVELLDSGRRATATLLQRKLRIDYELAVEVLSELTSRGLVSGDDDRS